MSESNDESIERPRQHNASLVLIKIGLLMVFLFGVLVQVID